MAKRVYIKAMEDKAFCDQSGGGVTLSGGEPLFFWGWAAWEYYGVSNTVGNR